MKLMTRFELTKHSKNELQVLYREGFGALVRSAFGSVERRSRSPYRDLWFQFRFCLG